MFEEVPKNRRYACLCKGEFKIPRRQFSFGNAEGRISSTRRFSKKYSGRSSSAADKIQDRPIFYHLIDDELKENDLLLVTKIDRCSRNTLEFLKLQERLHKKGVTFLSLNLPYSNDIALIS